MPNTITVTVPHSLGIETAKKRLAERLEVLRRDYVDKVARSEVSWAGDVATINVAALGQQASARIAVLADQVRIDIELPWALAAIAGKVRDVVAHNANDVLRIGKS
jgi:hypothetical protein